MFSYISGMSLYLDNMNKNIAPRILWPLIIASCAPLLFIIKLPPKMTSSSIALYLASLTGYAGLMLLLWMYVLGAKSVTRLFFKDLAPVLGVHKDLGKYGSIAFLLHPVFAVYGFFTPSLKSLTYIFLPNTSSLIYRHIALGQIAFYCIAVIWVTSIFFRKRLGFRAWKYIHYFAYFSLPFAILHVPDLGPQFMASRMVKLYFLAIAGSFVVASLFRLSGWLNLDRKRYIIVNHSKITDHDFMIVLQPTTDEWLAPEAGQYVYVKQGIISEDHPFSVTYYDEESGELTIIYRYTGTFTRYLTGLAQGEEVSIMGPFGAFTQDIPEDGQQPVVYLAGGVGVTPFVQRLIDNRRDQSQLLFMANRTHSTAPLVRTLKKALGDRLVAIYSRDMPAGAGEESGRISEALLRKYIAAPRSSVYYICGSEPFVEECKRILGRMNIAPERIRQEEFSW